MATWHQMQNPVKRYHETKWSVWIDPPNDCAAVYLYDTHAEAMAMFGRLKENGHEYVFVYKPEVK